jgi:hypothetical protein
LVNAVSENGGNNFSRVNGAANAWRGNLVPPTTFWVFRRQAALVGPSAEPTLRRHVLPRACTDAGAFNGGHAMKYFVSMLAIASALAVTSPAFAGPDNQADCEAAGGTWNADSGSCEQ